MPSESSDKLKAMGRRKHIRFSAAPNTSAQIGFQDDLGNFQPEHLGLVMNESYQGCAVAFLAHADIYAGRTCIVACGSLDPMKARIVRVQPLGSDVISVAFEYLG
jgi:hypothetical protein